jgi:hypothetical protein
MSMTAAEFIVEALVQTGLIEFLKGRRQGPFTIQEI